MTPSAPKYRQIYDFFRSRIVDGELEVGVLLPTEQEVTEQFGVSRITARRAFNELQADGLVKRRQGRGTVVAFNSALPNIKASFDTLLANLNQIGLKTEVRLLSVETLEATPGLCAEMDLRTGDWVQKIERQRTLDDRAFSYIITYIPKAISDKYNDDALKTGSVIKLLDQIGHAPVEAAQSISAVSAEKRIAKALDIEIGAPVLAVHRIMRDKDNAVVQHITSYYRSDRFHYHMTLYRNTDVEWADN